jgi:hypothetical protein
MADDNILRSFRSSDLTRRASAPAAPKEVGGSDPLAELARLIGQNDPFADLERHAAQASPSRGRAEPAPSDWRKTAAAMARESMREPQPDSRYAEVDSAIAAARSLRASPDDRFDQYAAHAAFDQPAHAHADFADDHYAEGRYGDHAAARYGDDGRADAAADHAYYDHHADAQPVAQESENYFFDGAAVPADERSYDDPPRARTANSLLTILVLVGCGILGTAGAYGYRTYYSGTHETDAPIIPAEKTPNKMIPAAGGADSTGKPIKERVADNGGEKVVSRQEEPITLTDPGSAPAGPNGPRVVLPAPFTPSPGPGPAVQSGPGPGPVGSPNDPKKVHTVAIRPEGGAVDPMARPVSSPNPPLQTAPAPVATRQPSPPPVARPAPPPRNSAGPLSIDPQGQPGPADTSSYQPPAAAPRLASVPPAAAGGGYVVQVSSQRSEAEAQTSFRSLQSKFPSQLGDREGIVRRADLGPKGIFYRAMVGPFGSAGDADQFCNGLKAAGGQCIVQKN